MSVRGADISAAAPNTGQTSFVSMPSLRILACRVVRFMPSLAAAPASPPTSPAGIAQRADDGLPLGGRQRATALAPTPAPRFSSRTGAAAPVPVETITARSMKFCSSRMLPGQ